MAEPKRDPQTTDRRWLPRNRASSLRQLAASLPSVDDALDELIARANQTELDIGRWSSFVGKPLREPEPPDVESPDVESPEIESVDVGLLEVKLRDAEAREQALRHQLDHLQGRLADAEGRTAVAAPRAATARSLPWLAVGCAFLGGLALMFAAGALQARESAGGATPAAMPKPLVTPIEAPTVTPIDLPAVAPPPAAPPPAAVPAVAEPKPTGAGVPHVVVAKPRARHPAPPAAPAHAAPPRDELADPFAGPARPGDRPKPRDPGAPSPIVNPF